MKKLKIGVTGGIGSGKSKFCEAAKKLGYDVILADEISKNILTADYNVKQQIIEAFGKNAFVDNLPNKKFLADVVFSNADNLVKINSILHPPTLKKINNLMSASLKEKDMVFVESAIIFEIEIEEMFDYVVLITASEEIRIKRTMERSKLTRDEIITRINNQLPDENKKGLADFTIENNTTLEDLEKKCGFIINLLKNMGAMG
ncbi:MAG: dephospho-CoA kinase [bacterium]